MHLSGVDIAAVARSAGDIDRLLHGAQQRGGCGQCHVVSMRIVAEHRFVICALPQDNSIDVWEIYLHVDLGPLAVVKTSGDEIPPSLAIAGDSLYSSLRQSHACLPESSSWRHLQACMTSGCLSTWPANLSLRVLTISDRDCIPDTFTSTLQFSYDHAIPDTSSVEIYSDASVKAKATTSKTKATITSAKAKAKANKPQAKATARPVPDNAERMNQHLRSSQVQYL